MSVHISAISGASLFKSRLYDVDISSYIYIENFTYLNKKLTRLGNKQDRYMFRLYEQM